MTKTAAGPATSLKVHLKGGDQGALVVGKPFFSDMTAWDAAGNELLPEDIVAQKLAYTQKTSIVGVDGTVYASIQGAGADEDGKPNAGYETNSSDQISLGDAAWRDSLGSDMRWHANRPAADGMFFKIVAEAYGLTAESKVFRVGKAPKPGQHE